MLFFISSVYGYLISPLIDFFLFFYYNHLYDVYKMQVQNIIGHNTSAPLKRQLTNRGQLILTDKGEMMEQLILKAYAKINLGLDVLRKREDGYHEVKMIMQTVDLYDEIRLKKLAVPEIRLIADHKDIPSDPGNLAYKAAAVMLPFLPDGMGVEIVLDKKIPVAAGMAGGSSDGAAVIRGMNELYSLGFTMERLQKLSVVIGADVPYCIQGGTMLAEGIGEKLTRLPAAPDCFVVVAKPPVGVSTQYVYGNLKVGELKEHPDLDAMQKAILSGDLKKMGMSMGNVLETVTEKAYPVITALKKTLLAEGAVQALMSGSGPTVFGLFDSEEKARSAYERVAQGKEADQLFLTGFITEEESQESRER